MKEKKVQITHTQTHKEYLKAIIRPKRLVETEKKTYQSLSLSIF